LRDARKKKEKRSMKHFGVLVSRNICV
jgi:hypothetical protein